MAVAKISSPKDVKDVQSIMVRLSYHARFTPDLAKLAKHINRLRQKVTAFVCGQDKETAFAS